MTLLGFFHLPSCDVDGLNGTDITLTQLLLLVSVKFGLMLDWVLFYIYMKATSHKRFHCSVVCVCVCLFIVVVALIRCETASTGF